MTYLITNNDIQTEYNLGEIISPIRAYFLVSDSALDSEELSITYADDTSGNIKLDVVDVKDGKYYYSLPYKFFVSLGSQLTPTPTPTPTPIAEPTPTPTPIGSLEWTQIGEDVKGILSWSEEGSIGLSVSSSSDGNIFATGASNGPVKVYQNNNGVWTQVGQGIENTDEPAVTFDESVVALNSEGNIVAIGSPRNNNKIGMVRIYQNNNGTWTQIGDDINGEADGDQCGKSVSLNSDGNIVAFGAPYNDDNGETSGSVRIYLNNNGTWTQIGNDIDGESAGDAIGENISLNATGNIVAIGSRWSDGNGENSGCVRIYQNNDGTWTKIGQDIDGEAEGDYSGWSVSLNSDGNIVAIGSPYNDGNESKSGHVRIYQNNQGTWTQIGQDIDGESLNDQSGYSVSLNSEGNIVAIGAPYNDRTSDRMDAHTGHIRIYQNNNGTWIQLGDEIDGKYFSDKIGLSVSLNSAGNILITGGGNQDENGYLSGKVRIYEYPLALSASTPTPTPIPEPTPTPTPISESDFTSWTQVGQTLHGEIQGGASVSMSSDGNIVAYGSNLRYSENNPVRVYQNTNETWTQLGQDIDPPSGGFQRVELSSNGNVVAIGIYEYNIGDPDNNIERGIVQIYQNTNGTWTQIGDDILGQNENERFGVNLSLNSDGSIVAIGGNGNSESGESSGVTRIYQNNDGTWTKIGQDIYGEAEGDYSGTSVSLSSDGNIVAIGATGNDGNGITNPGRIQIYQNISGYWTQIGQDIYGNESEYLGSNVKLSSNGNIVAISSRTANDHMGLVRIYQNISGYWTQIGDDINNPSVPKYGYFGTGLSLSADGSIVAIGEPSARFWQAGGRDLAWDYCGLVRIYQNNNGTWTQIGQTIQGQDTWEQFGTSLSLNSEGTMIAIGGHGNTGQTRIYKITTNMEEVDFESKISEWREDRTLAESKYGSISDWDTSKVTRLHQTFAFMGHSFSGKSLVELDLSKWDVSNVTRMSKLFWQCSGLTSLNVSTWDVSKVTNMEQLFSGVPLTSLNVSSWNTSNVTNMDSMFNRCTLLENIDMSNWCVSKIPEQPSIFVSSYTPISPENLPPWGEPCS